MTEVLFYHLQNISLESVLPPLLEKSLERGWRVVVQSTSQERTDALDAHLWTYNDNSFLPHATWRAGDAQDQPIILSIEEGNPNRANVRFLIDNAALPAIPTATSGWYWSLTATMPMRFTAARDYLDRLQGAGLRGDLLAGGRAGQVAASAIAISLGINDNLWFLYPDLARQPWSCRKLMLGQVVTVEGGSLGLACDAERSIESH